MHWAGHSDSLFAALYKLFSDPSNETLRNEVDKTIKSRLSTIDALRNKAEPTAQDIKESTTNMIEYQKKLQTLSKSLDSPDIPNMLRDREPSEEDVQSDLEAVARIQVS